MKIFVKQELYMFLVHHNDSLISSFIWYITRKNKHCRKFCPLCKYYFRCQEDVEIERQMEGK